MGDAAFLKRKLLYCFWGFSNSVDSSAETALVLPEGVMKGVSDNQAHMASSAGP